MDNFGPVHEESIKVTLPGPAHIIDVQVLIESIRSLGKNATLADVLKKMEDTSGIKFELLSAGAFLGNFELARMLAAIQKLGKNATVTELLRTIPRGFPIVAPPEFVMQMQGNRGIADLLGLQEGTIDKQVLKETILSLGEDATVDKLKDVLGLGINLPGRTRNELVAGESGVEDSRKLTVSPLDGRVVL